MIEAEGSKFAAAEAEAKKTQVTMCNVPVEYMYLPTPRIAWSPTQLVGPDPGDRVLSLRSDEGVPFGTRGVVRFAFSDVSPCLFRSDLLAVCTGGRCARQLLGYRVGCLIDLGY